MTDHHQILNLSCKRKNKAVSNGNLLTIEDGIELKVCKSIIEVANIWYRVVPKDNVFFSIPYLGLLEEFPLSSSRMRYGIIYKDGNPIAAMICQERDFKLIDSLKEPDQRDGTFSKLSNWIREKIAYKIKIKGMVCGNLSLTGEYGFHFKTQELSHKRQFELVEKSMDAMTEYIKLVEGIDITITFIKDFYEDKNFKNQDIKNSSYAEFSVQPNMIMSLDKNWKSFDDYLASLTSKYRVRVRRAFKKAEKIERKLLSWSEIQKYEHKIFDLYSEITDKAEFNLAKLHPRYFTELKKELPRRVKIYGYFLDNDLIAFNSLIWNENDLEAHYLGYEQQYNRDYQLYLNMLFDIIQEGIQSKMNSIVFARTALEIKSSVGAVPKDMFLYLKHRNTFNNRFVPRLLKYLSPVEEWVPRQPFKEKENLVSEESVKP
jgi:hypothetical protein